MQVCPRFDPYDVEEEHEDDSLLVRGVRAQYHNSNTNTKLALEHRYKQSKTSRTQKRAR